jgi:hypothetical protein
MTEKRRAETFGASASRCRGRRGGRGGAARWKRAAHGSCLRLGLAKSSCAGATRRARVGWNDGADRRKREPWVCRTTHRSVSALCSCTHYGDDTSASARPTLSAPNPLSEEGFLGLVGRNEVLRFAGAARPRSDYARGLGPGVGSGPAEPLRSVSRPAMRWPRPMRALDFLGSADLSK